LTKTSEGAAPSFFKWFAFEKSESEDEMVMGGDDIALQLADDIYPQAHVIFRQTMMGDSDEEMDEEEEEDLEDESGKLVKCRLTDFSRE
jgi:hypothetical protein